jgi:hypothetical protein
LSAPITLARRYATRLTHVVFSFGQAGLSVSDEGDMTWLLEMALFQLAWIEPRITSSDALRCSARSHIWSNAYCERETHRGRASAAVDARHAASD